MQLTSGGEVIRGEDHIITLEAITSEPESENPYILTREDSINQIISSIAMENLALSHVLNAEGEKIQYVLKDFSREGGRNATVNEVLATNESVQEMLMTVLNYQMLLNSKLFSAVDSQDASNTRRTTGCC